MPPVSSVDTELVTASPAGRWAVFTAPVARSSVPTTPCWVKNQTRPSQSGIVAIRQSSFGMCAARLQTFCLAIVPSARTCTCQTALSTVVG